MNTTEKRIYHAFGIIVNLPFIYLFIYLLIRTCSGAHPASYSMGIGDSFLGDKGAKPKADQ
jgi:hypothetical protein